MLVFHYLLWFVKCKYTWFWSIYLISFIFSLNEWIERLIKSKENLFRRIHICRKGRNIFRNGVCVAVHVVFLDLRWLLQWLYNHKCLFCLSVCEKAKSSNCFISVILNCNHPPQYPYNHSKYFNLLVSYFLSFSDYFIIRTINRTYNIIQLWGIKSFSSALSIKHQTVNQIKKINLQMSSFQLQKIVKLF